MAIVDLWQSTGGHNQLSWVGFPASASFKLFHLDYDYLWFSYQFDDSI